MVLVESSVDAPDVEREVERAGLETYVATLPRDGPLPTLREMVASGRRLVVLDQGDGGDAPWYQPAFLFAQDTRIRSLLRSRTACDPERGTPDNPLLVMNHWIDRFPPPPKQNRKASDRATLIQRVRSCRERLGRTPNAIAVDFYARGDAIAVATELNRTGAAAGDE